MKDNDIVLLTGKHLSQLAIETGSNSVKYGDQTVNYNLPELQDKIV